MLLVMPLTGFAFVAYSGIELRYFSLVRLPALVAEDKPVANDFLAAHATLQWAIYGLALPHIGAALHHHLVRRNDVLARMLPGVRRLSRDSVA